MKKILLNGLLNGLLSSTGIVVVTCLILNDGVAAEGVGDAGGGTTTGDAGASVPSGSDSPIPEKIEAEKITTELGEAEKKAELEKQIAANKANLDAKLEEKKERMAERKVAADKAEAEKAALAQVTSPVTPSVTPSVTGNVGASASSGSVNTATAKNKVVVNVGEGKDEYDAKFRKRLKKEAVAGIVPETTASTTPIPALSEEQEERQLTDLINTQYKKILNDIRVKLGGCSSQSDCLDKSKSVFKNTLESLGTKSGYGSSSYSSYSSSSKPELPAEPLLKDSVKYVKGRNYIKTGESDRDFTKRLQQEINNHYEDKIEHYEKEKKKYTDNMVKWRNQILREKSKKMVENFQSFFQTVYDKEIFPTQILIYEHLSENGKKDYLARRLVTDPSKVRLYADETTQSTSKKKGDDNSMWAKIGAGAIGTILGGMLGSSSPPPAPSGVQRQGQRPGTPQQGNQSPYATPKPGTQYQNPAQRPSSSGSYGSAPARPQQQQQPKYGQQPQTQPYGRYQNNSYSVEEGAVFLQPIVFGEAYGNDYSYGRKSSYDSSSSSYSSLSSSTGKKGEKEIPPKEYRFNRDDILLFAMDEIEKKHRSCSNHKDCLKQDSDRIAAIANSLGEKDPSRDVLLEIAEDIEARANTSYVAADKIIQAFEDGGYEGSTASSLKSKLREEWEGIASTRSKSRTSREPRVINEVELKKAHRKVIRVEDKKTERKNDYRDGYSQREKQQEPQKKEEGGLMGMFGKLFGGS